MRPRATLIDALGTMLWLEPPWELLDPELVAGVPPERLRDAFGEEMAFYRARSEQGRDPQSLAELRRRCAAVLSRALGREIGVEAMMDAIRFRAYDDAAPTLAALRARGVRTVCVSNWDCSLPDVLAGVGLAEHLDGVVSSAAVGARKPDPAIFAAALELAGSPAERALHVGDSDEDVAGARAAGIAVLRIDRDGGGGDIASLNELEERVAW